MASERDHAGDPSVHGMELARSTAATLTPPQSWGMRRTRAEAGNTPPAKRATARVTAEPPADGQYADFTASQMSTALRMLLQQRDLDTAWMSTVEGAVTDHAKHIDSMVGRVMANRRILDEATEEIVSRDTETRKVLAANDETVKTAIVEVEKVLRDLVGTADARLVEAQGKLAALEAGLNETRAAAAAAAQGHETASPDAGTQQRLVVLETRAASLRLRHARHTPHCSVWRACPQSRWQSALGALAAWRPISNDRRTQAPSQRHPLLSPTLGRNASTSSSSNDNHRSKRHTKGGSETDRQAVRTTTWPRAQNQQRPHDVHSPRAIPATRATPSSTTRSPWRTSTTGTR